MSDRIVPVPVEALGEPTREVLRAFADLSNGAVQFDLDAASSFSEMPEKPYFARSDAEVEYQGQAAGTLITLALDPGQGTGDTSLFTSSDIAGELWQQGKGNQYLPRRKDGVRAEAHLAIAAFAHSSQKLQPVLFANNLELVGVINLDDSDKVRALAELGQSSGDFREILARNRRGQTTGAKPTATLTVGNRGDIAGQERGERFGDPHAVYNHRGMLQIAGFLAVKEEDSGAEARMNMLQKLGAVEPRLLF